jgi:hypothetical protein
MGKIVVRDSRVNSDGTILKEYLVTWWVVTG